MNKIRRFFKKLGPGLITGAADDDPSGIATYAIAGARFGYGLLWTAWVTFPLMAAIQETCARIGLVARTGLAGVIRQNYPRPVLFVVSGLLLVANIFNIGANLSGMAAAVRLILPVEEIAIGFLVAVVLVILTIRLPYQKIAAIFKWLTLALLAYAVTFFLIKHDVLALFMATFLPALSNFSVPAYLMTLLAVFGTTISPYLFFWQTSEEAEEEKLAHKVVTKYSLRVAQQDTVAGMFFSNLVMFFIMATTAGTLFTAGLTNLDSAAEAALALRPLAGDLAFLLFAVGIIGTGVLAIPVLAGSAAYAVAETFRFSEGLDKPWQKARAFYGVIIAATMLGFLLNLLGINPIKYLFYSAVLNGVTAPVLIAMILLIANNKKIMGQYTNSLTSNLFSLITLVIMSLAAVAIFVVK